jgi:hypothetical protein
MYYARCHIMEHFINFNKSMLTILSTSVPVQDNMHVITREAFPLKCWLPPDDGHHWLKHVKA